MKKITVFITLFLMCFGLRSQSTLNSYTSTTRFFNSDFLQMYQGARIAAPTMTLPNSISTYTSTTPFVNTDNLQVYNAIRGIGDAVSTGTANSWNITGNAPSTNTNFIGTTSNRSFLLKTNNLQRMKVDSNGNFEFHIDTISFSKIPFVVNGGNTVNGNNPYMQLKGYYIGAYRLLNTTTGREWSMSNMTFGSELDYFTIGRGNNPTARTFKIDTVGRVNIGGKTTAFTASLEVTGTMSVSSNATVAGTSLFRNILTIDRASQPAATCLSINGGSASANAFQISADGTNSLVTLNARNSYSLGFQLNDVNRVTLNSGGLNVLTTLSVQSTSTLTGLRNNATFTTTGAAMIGGTTAGSATLHVLGTFSASSSGTLAGVLSTSSVVSTSKTAGIGYAVGSGSTVTQGTSRTTGVTINDVVGSITLFNTAGSATYQDFTVTNSTVGVNDVIIINQRSGTDRYVIEITAVAAGSFRVTFATTGGTTSEAPVFNFAVIKGATN